MLVFLIMIMKISNLLDYIVLGSLDLVLLWIGVVGGIVRLGRGFLGGFWRMGVNALFELYM
jgi:hypothetical protein